MTERSPVGNDKHIYRKSKNGEENNMIEEK